MLLGIIESYFRLRAPPPHLLKAIPQANFIAEVNLPDTPRGTAFCGK